MMNATTVELFVNGTLMRGDVLHGNLAGARFVTEARTAPRYRLFSIGDIHPGMIKAADPADGVSIAGELYELTLEHLERLIVAEPRGLGVGVVELADGGRRLGILWVAPELHETAIDISHHGDWRAYRAHEAARAATA
jgi:adenine/guanine/hypoxanthine permease